MNWPPDERDEMARMAKNLVTAHFDVQHHLLAFHITADAGETVPDTPYTSLFVAIGRLQKASVDLRKALVTYRTTAHVPAVKEGGGG